MQQILTAIYDLSSCGLGVQQAVVSALLPNPTSGNSPLLFARELSAGPGSNLLSPTIFTAENSRTPEDIYNFRGRLALLQRDWIAVHRRALRLLSGSGAISAKDISEGDFRVIAKNSRQ
jgi:hypothetical protein